MRTRLDTLANLALIATCALLIVVLSNVWLAQRASTTQRELFKTGDIVRMGIDFRASQRTLLLVFRNNCRFCTDSMPFYRELARKIASAGSNVRFIGVTPQNLDIAHVAGRTPTSPVVGDRR